MTKREPFAYLLEYMYTVRGNTHGDMYQLHLKFTWDQIHLYTWKVVQHDSHELCQALIP